MTKDEAKAFLKGKKFYAGFKQQELTKILREAGIHIRFNEQIATPFILITEGGNAMGQAAFSIYDSKDFGTEIYTSDVLSIVIDKPEVEFQPFDRVTVRNHEKHKWCADIYSYKTGDNEHLCIGGVWGMCKPYEGSEHLVGTNQ